MSDFKTAYRQAFKEISPQKFQTAVSSSMKSGRNTLIAETARFIKGYAGIKRALAAIKQRIEKSSGFKKSPKGIIDTFFVSNPSFSFLALPNKTKKRKLPPKRRGVARRLSGAPSQRILESVRIGKSFKKYEGVFIAVGNNNNKLPFRRKDKNDWKSDIESMQYNAFNVAYREEKNLDIISTLYTKKVFDEFSKKIIRSYYKNLNKTVDFVVKQ